MAILIANDGDRVVSTIAGRNALLRKFNGMKVRVTDAIADTRVGSGSAEYEWDAGQSRWLLIWKESKDNIIFTHEHVTIVNGEVTASHYPKSGSIWDATIRDETGIVVAYVEPDSIIGDVIAIGTTEYDGKELYFTYGYSAVENAVSQSIAYTLQPASANILGGVKIGSGLTIDNTGKLSTTADAEWSVIGNTYNAAIGEKILADTSVGSFSITLPSTPAMGDMVRISDYSASFDINPLTVFRNGNKILGISDDLSVDIKNHAVVLVFANANSGWVYGA
jgi:hypothetical protein